MAFHKKPSRNINNKLIGKESFKKLKGNTRRSKFNSFLNKKRDYICLKCGSPGTCSCINKKYCLIV